MSVEDKVTELFYMADDFCINTITIDTQPALF